MAFLLLYENETIKLALTTEQIQKLRQEITSCARPLILFDDDPDGLASFLQIYRHVKDGKGFPVKNSKTIGPDMARKIEEYSPDLVIILDIPIVSQDFLDVVKTKVVWVDHHPVLERRNVEYYNPRTNDPADNRPTSYWVYQALQENLWVAMMGIVGDWSLPEDLKQKLIEEYPDLLSPDVTHPEVALHKSRLGTLIRMASFNLKGKAVDAMKSVKVFTRIKDPHEILDQTTAGGKFIYKKYAKLNSEYEKLLISVKPTDDRLLFVRYNNPDISFSQELSNELIFLYPDKVVLVVWEYNGEYKCSLRCTDSLKMTLPQLIEKSLEGIHGYGGGHDHAAGACVKEADMPRFVENIRKLI